MHTPPSVQSYFLRGIVKRQCSHLPSATVLGDHHGNIECITNTIESAESGITSHVLDRAHASHVSKILHTHRWTRRQVSVSKTREMGIFHFICLAGRMSAWPPKLSESWFQVSLLKHPHLKRERNASQCNSASVGNFYSLRVGLISACANGIANCLRNT